ncbi:EamA family transporter RarD [Amnibacterium flavum]|uniref:EamA family transporter RarD n=1 Tax=Amnibacterium flavum TaxID=2173173 RepID=A0A2V1HUI2_9MICO|nr:EamA family transporter RarD [Amnibacterium flavum]PVZ96276.1 EamA family transporter RarD [Amnibacterium flavum]
MTDPTASPSAAPAKPSRNGLVAAATAYILWGFLPAYFVALSPVGPFEIVAWRILFALAFCLLLLTVTRAWKPFIVILRRPRTVLLMGVAGLLIFVNWQTFIFGTLTGHVVETALGYFINPIVTVFLGVLVLRERLRPLQWVAVGISIVAVVVLTIGYGSLPWIALVLAASFGTYGLIKKQVGGEVDAMSGLTLETAWLVPVAVVELAIVGATTGLVFGSAGALNTTLVVASGAITAIPLLLFAAAASRLPLTVIGFVQYIAPILQFLYGVFLLREPMPPERWFGFAIVWVALAVLSFDLLRAGARSRRSAAILEPAP